MLYIINHFALSIFSVIFQPLKLYQLTLELTKSGEKLLQNQKNTQTAINL